MAASAANHPGPDSEQGWTSWVGSRTKTGLKNIVGRGTRITVNSLMKLARTAYEAFTGERLEQMIADKVQQFLDVEIVLSNSGPSN